MHAAYLHRVTSWEEGIKQTNFTNKYLIAIMTSMMKDRMPRQQKGPKLVF